MFRVLHIMAGADAGGISTVVLNYYKYIDREKYHFDIALTTDMIGQNGMRLKELGAKIYFLPLKSERINLFKNELEKLLRKEQFDAVHVHENETSYVALMIAKKMGIKCRVAHAHTSAPFFSVKGEIRRLSGCILNYHYATRVIGCGELAGNRVFGRINMKRSKAMVLPNAIEIERFQFNEIIRKQMRSELGVSSNFVIGMVGRLGTPKNQLFVLDFIDEIYKMNPSVKLIIAGNGPDEEEIKRIIKEKKMETYIILLGRRADVEKLYQAFDIFIMPSTHEGFPVAAVEAMTSGLPVLLSDSITKELAFGEHVKYIPLNKTKWIDEINKCCPIECRSKSVDEIKHHGLDICDTTKMLESVYTINC